ncbi:MAG: polysaccharide deacetylase family protein [candidate division WOR-3 bacterium]|nr:MAG: polysaccharide deacetylase family protein [candidate division WOR-3 bacterium]
MYYLLTNDVEMTSIQRNRLDYKMGELVAEYALPRLLDIYERHGIRTTFYFTGVFVEHFPQSVVKVKESGHEVGCHGYSHEVERGLDTLSYEEQLHDIAKAKRIIEKYAGQIKAFRSPALRIGAHTARVLDHLGFETDSSIASQRFDGPLSFGSAKKMRWLVANRTPYFVDGDDLYRVGDSNLLEIPISAFILAHVGTLMRISPEVDAFLRDTLFLESRLTKKPLVFMIHPNECVVEDGRFKAHRRAKNMVSYLFADVVRGFLKQRNIGQKASLLLEREIVDAKKKGFEFLTCDDYRRIFEREHRNPILSGNQLWH